MKADAALLQLADLVGVFRDFTDMQSIVHQCAPDTQRALIAANGIAAVTDAEVRESFDALCAQQSDRYLPDDVVVTAGEAQKILVDAPVEWGVLSEADEKLLAEGQTAEAIDLPALPLGVHVLNLKGERGAQHVTLIASPKRCPSVQDLTGQNRVWGVVAALYGLTTGPRKSLADFEDLSDLAQLLGRRSAGFVGVNPVHALGVSAHDTISPYSPTHRGFLNTDHIALSQKDAPAIDLGLLDYASHRCVQNTELASGFEVFKESGLTDQHADFDLFCTQGGAALDDFAHYETISETYGPDWRRWPQNPTGETRDKNRVLFHKWMQWRADTQLAAAQAKARSSGMALGLYLDLAVGARVGGAESWGGQSAAADGVTLGAPPDHLSPAGQNWQLAGLSPRKLQAGKYDAFRFVLRQNMRHCGVLRIDHALGLSRSFWIPEDGSPGGYIRQPFQSLTAIIAIEAQRAGTIIVGEDLGLVPTGFRDEMATQGLYGYSVLQYEKDDAGTFTSPQQLRAQSLACFGTHDTPTLAGFWQSADVAWWEKLGWITPPQAAKARKDRAGEKRQLSGIKARSPLPAQATPKIRDTVHATLAQAPAALVAVQLDDILGLSVAQNLPGTIDEHPNWRRTYPLTLDQIAESAALRETADLMARAGRASQMRKDST